jgi:co-chaperonin GroES (HSP10)
MAKKSGMSSSEAVQLNKGVKGTSIGNGATGPWCKVGDYVMFRANTGTRFKVGKQEYRLMNDDSIEAVVDDPRAVSRA